MRRTRLADRRDDERQAGLVVRVQEVLRSTTPASRGSARQPPPGARRVRDAARPVVRHPEIELRRGLCGCVLTRRLSSSRPAASARTRRRSLLQRVVAPEDHAACPLAVVQKVLRAPEGLRLSVAAGSEVEEERRTPRARLRHRAGRGRALPRVWKRLFPPFRRRRRMRRPQRCEDTRAGSHKTPA